MTLSVLDVVDAWRFSGLRRRAGSVRYARSAGLFSFQDGRVLLLRRRIEPARGKWSFPAGYVELGESLEEAAIRETREEVALEIDELSLLNVYSYRESPVVTIVYFSPAIRGEPRAGTEAEEVAFFSPEELPWEELAFRSTREALEDWVRRIGYA
jgi:ADP-ribose pyrophosphatase YjhB (NUDIX family)